MIRLRRVYDPAEKDEGYTILVDRLWPRGISKEKANWDEWMKEIAPGNELRKWYSHDPDRWEEFKRRYREELGPADGQLARLRQLEDEHGTITLLYASAERNLNNAAALKEFLKE